MPKKLFLSSTCYDLNEIRVNVEAWARAHWYDSVLSDRADFPVDPQIHRHDVCLANARKADLVVILLAGRFGAPYYADQKISITWAEFRAASAAGVPIVVFVDKRVWDERNKLRTHPDEPPMFTQDRRTFDLLSEIQAHEQGYWMEIYETPDAILRRLDSLAVLFPITLHEPGGGIKKSGSTIVTGSLSAEAQHHIRLVAGELQYLSEDNLQQAMLEIPETSEERPWGCLDLHGFSILVDELTPAPAARYQVRPTPIGEAILAELRFAFSLL
jgi:Domain of unknown function (DUF4062)